MTKEKQRNLFDCDYCSYKTDCHIPCSREVRPLKDFELTNGITLTCEDFRLILENCSILKVRMQLAKNEIEEGLE